ncbi:MAG TPA: hypothetical protein VFV64_12810, partial [Permianibacter sp.]|nr:hypothetical protein [Permianibacter sp.]
QELAERGYLAEPHAAVAYAGLQAQQRAGEYGIFLATAHPAKFKEAVETILKRPIALPAVLAAVESKPLLSQRMAPDLSVLQQAIARCWS